MIGSQHGDVLVFVWEINFPCTNRNEFEEISIGAIYALMRVIQTQLSGDNVGDDWIV